MPNLIFEAEIDNSLIDQFLTDGPGFPDQTMLNPETGLRDSSVLERMIGMTRAVRRIEAAKHKPGQRVMDYQPRPTGRMLLLINDLYLAQQRIKKKSKASEGFRSWEMVPRCQDSCRLIGFTQTEPRGRKEPCNAALLC